MLRDAFSICVLSVSLTPKASPFSGHPLEDPDVYELSWCIDVTEHPEATDPLQRYSAMGCFQTREPVVSA